MSNSNDYDVNFFKPITEHARANAKLITIMFLIWAFAVFGFQFMLIIFNKPTPEKNYVQFQKDWPAIIETTSTVEMNQEFSRTLLSVLGKNIVLKANDKITLQNALHWSVYNLLDEEAKVNFLNDLKNNKEKAIETTIQAIGLKDTGFDMLRRDLLPSSLISNGNGTISNEELNAIPGIMELYLVHNRSFLTDTIFMGFPFHYWYTAQFLLIMFVILCLIYAKITDKQNEKHNFVEKD